MRTPAEALVEEQSFVAELRKQFDGIQQAIQVIQALPFPKDNQEHLDDLWCWVADIAGQIDEAEVNITWLEELTAE